ncbi:type VI secretion system tube protein TssD [Terrimonas ferruginea]|uniref:type VI secretion system tube protein TssD n=1 Tax=Terrimonas ferruginea TaxID=249 RepID=UPI00040740C9|nr:type VI secretion system tube protein TssD [Terrimonas ferruginea]
MSFKAKLTVAGKDYVVLNCQYSLHQEVDSTGRPSSITRGGKISVTVESNSGTELFEWMCNNFERKDGTITFFKRDSDARMKELNFKEGYVVNFEERFAADNDQPMIITFGISAKEISMGNGTHKNEWV